MGAPNQYAAKRAMFVQYVDGHGLRALTMSGVVRTASWRRWGFMRCLNVEEFRVYFVGMRRVVGSPAVSGNSRQPSSLKVPVVIAPVLLVA